MYRNIHPSTAEHDRKVMAEVERRRYTFWYSSDDRFVPGDRVVTSTESAGSAHVGTVALPPADAPLPPTPKGCDQEIPPVWVVYDGGGGYSKGTWATGTISRWRPGLDVIIERSRPRSGLGLVEAG